MNALIPSPMNSELRLKLAIVKLLPEEITFTGINFLWMKGPYSCQVVRDTEWDYVVRMAVAAERDYCHAETWKHEAKGLLERRGIQWET